MPGPISAISFTPPFAVPSGALEPIYSNSHSEASSLHSGSPMVDNNGSNPNIASMHQNAHVQHINPNHLVYNQNDADGNDDQKEPNDEDDGDDSSTSSHRKFMCAWPDCGQSFGTRFSMKRHEKTHTRAKPFQCEFCDKSFAEKSTLVRHIRIHTGDKPYECRYCGQRFADRTNLKRHELQHVKQQKKAELAAKEREKEAAKEDKKKKKVNGSADEAFLQISSAAAAAAAISFAHPNGGGPLPSLAKPHSP